MSTALLKPGQSRDEAQLPAGTVQGSLSWALTLPFLFLVDHGTFSFQSTGTAVGGFSPGGVATRDPGIFGYAFAAVAYLMVAWLIKSRLRGVIDFVVQFKMLTLLALLAVFSALWSQSPGRSLLYGTLYLLGTLFGYYLVVRFEPEEIMAMLTRLGIIVSVLGLLTVVLLPGFGVTHDVRNGLVWNGIFTDRTGAARALVFLISPVLVSRGKQTTVKWLLSVSLMGLMIVMAHAVSAIFVLFIYIVFLFLLRLSRKVDSRLLMMVLVVGSFLSVLVAFFGIEYGADILKAFGRNTNLSGRTTIWSALALSILKRPLLGYGFFAFWQGIKGESGRVIALTHWTFGYAHNGIIEIFLQLGTIGVVVFFITLFKAIKDAWYCFRNDRAGTYDWYVGLVVITIFYNIDEATVVWPNDLLSIIYIVMCCGLAIGAKRLRQEKAYGSMRSLSVVSRSPGRFQAVPGKRGGSLARSAANTLQQGLAYLIRPLWTVPRKDTYQDLHQELLS